MRRLLPLVLICASGCAYYNGVYNAKAAARTADRQFVRGEGYLAAQSYLLSAAKAETVLARHPRTRWRPEALYVAGRGFALAGECGRGLIRLGEYLATAPASSRERDRALIARASCLVGTQVLAADTVLRPLLQSGDATVRAEASLWAGRAALQIGDAERAEELLARAPGNAAAWEFVAAALQSGAFERAESLLVARAQAGDWRTDVLRHLRTLWGAGAFEGAVRVADLYGASRAPTADRVAIRFLMSDLAAAAGDTALARRQATEAQRLGFSAAIDADARARLLAIRVRELETMSDVDAVLARDSVRARGTTILRRLTDNLSLIRMLLNNPDFRGAHLFLAAELARDSLHAYRLAHTFFRTVERDHGDHTIAARALLAARKMFPESTQVYDARIVAKWDSSSAAFSILGLDPAYSRINVEDAALSRAWRVVMMQWADTIRARKLADSLAAANAIRRE